MGKGVDEEGARCPRLPTPQRPPRLIAPAGCPPAAAASGACQSAAARRRGLVGSQLSGSCGAVHLECEGWGQGGGPGVGSLHTDFRSRESLPEDPWKFSTQGAGSMLSPAEARSPGRRPREDPCREGEESEQSGAPRRLPGTPACNSVAGAFPGLGDCGFSASHAVTAGDVSASTREEGTSAGAGFWASRELCPLSCSKKPNQKANLQASKPNVTLSAGRERESSTE